MDNIFEATKEEVKEKIEEQPEQSKPVSPPKVEDDLILKNKILGALGVDSNSKYALDVDRLLEYGKSKGYKNSEDIILNVRELLSEVGSPSQSGEDRIKRASRMAYLYLEQQDMNREMERLKNA